MNIGQLVSLIYCNKCGMRIEIYPNQEEVECPVCKNKINLIEKDLFLNLIDKQESK